jgi:hypothetical protein
MDQISGSRWLKSLVNRLMLSAAAGICVLAVDTGGAQADTIIVSPHGSFPNARAGWAASQAAEDAAASHIWDAVHSMGNLLEGADRGGGAINFAAEPQFDEAFEAFSALAYSPRDPKSPLITKARPLPPPVSAVKMAVWAMGYFDGERRSTDGADLGRDVRTWGGLAGMDFAKSGLTSANDTVVVGIIGGVGETHVSNRDGTSTKVTAPGVGVYGAYVNGPFSMDGLFKADFIGQDDTAGGVTIARELNNYVFAGNANYKINLAGGSWLEPTVGFIHTETVWGDAERRAGFQDGSITRLQGGARWGTELMWGSVRVQPTLGLFAFSDVSINGGTAGGAVVATDEGKVWGKGTGKLNFIVTQQVSYSVEGELRGTSHATGGAVRVAGRYSF